jgi:hypothetical protein
MAYSLLLKVFVRTGVALAVVMALAAPAVADAPAPEQRHARELVLGTGAFSAPLVHIAVGNPRGAARSFALRVTLPLATDTASIFDPSLFAKKPAKRTTREWRPDLTFRNGGVIAALRIKL